MSAHAILQLEGWSAWFMLYPGISKFGSLCSISEFNNASETQMISKLWITVNRDAFV